MSKVKWGIIGLGWFGEYHGDALAGLPNAEVYALCTRTESRLQGAGREVRGQASSTPTTTRCWPTRSWTSSA